MPTTIKALHTQPPAIVYARLLIEMHQLIDQGKGDAEEAEALADRMDAPWHAMTAREQARMRGLATDLNTLRDGRPRRVKMSPEELADWKLAMREVFVPGEIGDPDATLSALRRPIPSELPSHIIQTFPFLQSRCWERLGDLETALIFMKEADRQDPNQAVLVVPLLQQLGQMAELPTYANRVIANPNASPLERYIAAAALLSLTVGMSKIEATPILQHVVSVLRNSLAAYLALPPQERELADADAHMAGALGLSLERLGDLLSAIAVYTEALERNPRAGELYMARGLAQCGENKSKALSDLEMAARLGVPAIWPYLFLAQHSIQGGAPGVALKFARMAENQPGPPAARAEVYEIIGMALAELGQSQEWVLESFDRALALDPKNDRIQNNRAIATTLARPSQGGGRQRLPQLQVPPINLEEVRQVRSDEIRNRLEFFNEQRQSQIGQKLAAV